MKTYTRSSGVWKIKRVRRRSEVKCKWSSY